MNIKLNNKYMNDIVKKVLANQYASLSKNEKYKKYKNGVPIKQRVKHIDNIINSNVDDAIYRTAALIMEKAVEYTPVKTGKLRDSYTVTKVGYCLYRIDVNCEYAIYVHEIESNYHAVGRAKFLEEAAYEVSSELEKYDKMIDNFVEVNMCYQPLSVYVYSGLNDNSGLLDGYNINDIYKASSSIKKIVKNDKVTTEQRLRYIKDMLDRNGIIKTTTGYEVDSNNFVSSLISFWGNNKRDGMSDNDVELMYFNRFRAFMGGGK